jgi:hypothetical protein
MKSSRAASRTMRSRTSSVRASEPPAYEDGTRDPSGGPDSAAGWGSARLCGRRPRQPRNRAPAAAHELMTGATGRAPRSRVESAGPGPLGAAGRKGRHGRDKNRRDRTLHTDSVTVRAKGQRGPRSPFRRPVHRSVGRPTRVTCAERSDLHPCRSPRASASGRDRRRPRAARMRARGPRRSLTRR